MTRIFALFSIISLLSVGQVHAVADWVWHNQNRVPAAPDRTETAEVWVKVGYQFGTNNGAVYYTTDGTDPQGSRGVASNGQTVAFSFSHLEWDAQAQLNADWWVATIPGHERGTEVRYRVGFWDSNGGPEVFGDNNAQDSGSADVFSFIVGQRPVKAFSGQEFEIPVIVDIPGVTDAPGEASNLQVRLYSDIESATPGTYGVVNCQYDMDTPDGDRYAATVIPAEAGRRGYVVEVSTDSGATWQTWGDITEPESFSEVLVSPGWIRDAVLYQAFPRVHGATDTNGNGLLENNEFGDFRGMMADLNRIVALGADTLWMLPIHPLSTNPIHNKATDGSAGSPYAPKDYFAINPDYGTDQDLRDLIAAAKGKGLRVMLGFVANHVAPDYVLLDPNNPPANGGYKPEWFVQDAQGNPIPDDPNWSDTVAWNFEAQDRDALIQYIADALEYWVREYDIDGYRCDFAHWQPLDFWQKAIDQVRAVKPDVFFVAEGYELQSELIEAGFDAVYDYLPYNYLKEQVAPGNANAADFAAELEGYKTWQVPNYIPFRYGENHDEERVSVLYGSFERSKPHMAWTMFSRTVPMLYGGQEVADDRRIPLFRSWNSVQTYPAPDWSLNPQALAWYEEVLAVRKAQPALRRGSEQIISQPDAYVSVREYQGERLLVTINMTLASARRVVSVTVPEDAFMPGGPAQVRLRGLLSGRVITANKVGQEYRVPVDLGLFDAEVWAEDTGTTPTPTPQPTATATPVPSAETRLTITANQADLEWQANEPILVTAQLEDLVGRGVGNGQFFVLVDIFGQLYWSPSFVGVNDGLDFYTVDIPVASASSVITLLDFPAGVDLGLEVPLEWYFALLDGQSGQFVPLLLSVDNSEGTVLGPVTTTVN